MTERVKPDTLEPIPEIYAREGWQPVAFTHEEGGEWIPLTIAMPAPPRYAALQYKNGWIYDSVLRDREMIPWRHVEDTSTEVES